MAWIGSAPNKTTQRTDGTRTGSAVFAEQKTASVKIRADLGDIHAQDIADMINECMRKDGGNYNADADLNGNKFTDVGDASARTHFAAAGQIADGELIYAGTSAGTDTITATLSPAITAYVGGMMIVFRAGGTNTGAATLNVNSVGAADIRKGPAGTTALAAGDITSGGLYVVIYNGTTGDFELQNPKFPDGFATTDTPQFTGINIGAASDTTLTRASAGDLQIEASIIYRAGGTDVAVADGGTGASTAAAGFANLKQAASDTASGVLEIAVQAEMETATDVERAVVPGRQHFHPGHPKFWARVNVSGGTPSIATSYNTTSVTDTGVGELTVTIATDFSSANWCGSLTIEESSRGYETFQEGTITAGTVLCQAIDNNGSNQDPASWHVSGLGDLA